MPIPAGYTSGQIVQAVPTGINSAFVYLTGASFSAVTSFSLPANTFSTTYRNYKMIIQLTNCTSDATFTGRLRASGTDNSASSYFTLFQGIDNTGTQRGNTGSGQTSFNMGQTDGTTANVRNTYSLDIISPQVTENTYLLGQMTWVDTGASFTAGFAGGAVFTGTTQFDSFSFISSVASSITGVYRVYGYADN